MVTDPIGDLLVRLKNGAQRRFETVTVPTSKLKRAILEILKREGYVEGIEDGTENGHPVLHVRLRYVGEGQPMITGLERISKPGRRVYVGSQDIQKVRNGIGVSILSTSKGIMTDQESRKSHLGGEVLCSVW
ncbi:MAG: 30S ribosomal protein S8 [Nitrospira sp. HN-bin3]|jgi:small subunit ribosomal protein S8|uniref:30S ribosomal protein S8 n=1 Tax=Nitrospira cf. moscoviensis SBR1015 TaxID=96242 RepID=UPI000A09B003|nr:30S ribosomal protein S8 [Nitrospira cf. moscoviensis SBR1015]MBH0207587.1 30S ribosomal protein S8 [Nitrospira sp.]OQW44543.1 MAG: 30S ribosomal protein S8 [Nitrospira sp. HN-bin3]